MKEKVILIAEDNPEMRELFVTVLEHDGYTVLQAENGAVAVGIAQHFRPDLIIMDLAMPLMDGYTAAEIIRAQPALRETPIVALTAHVLVADARDHVFEHVATKPIEAAALRELVARYLSRAEMPPEAD